MRLDDFDEALELFVLAHSEGIQLDRLYYNTVLQRAGEKVIYILKSKDSRSLLCNIITLFIMIIKF